MEQISAFSLECRLDNNLNQIYDEPNKATDPGTNAEFGGDYLTAVCDTRFAIWNLLHVGQKMLGGTTS